MNHRRETGCEAQQGNPIPRESDGANGINIRNLTCFRDHDSVSDYRLAASQRYNYEVAGSREIAFRWSLNRCEEAQ